jgi:hypothetical protein
MVYDEENFVMYKPTGKLMAYKSKKETIAEINEIMRVWELKGYKKPNEVPESPQKERYRQLLKSLGLNVQF